VNACVWECFSGWELLDFIISTDVEEVWQKDWLCSWGFLYDLQNRAAVILLLRHSSQYHKAPKQFLILCWSSVNFFLLNVNGFKELRVHEICLPVCLSLMWDQIFTLGFKSWLILKPLLGCLCNLCQAGVNMKSSDAKATKCHLKFSSKNDHFYQACIFKFSNFT